MSAKDIKIDLLYVNGVERGVVLKREGLEPEQAFTDVRKARHTAKRHTGRQTAGDLVITLQYDEIVYNFWRQKNREWLTTNKDFDAQIYCCGAARDIQLAKTKTDIFGMHVASCRTDEEDFDIEEIQQKTIKLKCGHDRSVEGPL